MPILHIKPTFCQVFLCFNHQHHRSSVYLWFKIKVNSDMTLEKTEYENRSVCIPAVNLFFSWWWALNHMTFALRFIRLSPVCLSTLCSALISCPVLPKDIFYLRNLWLHLVTATFTQRLSGVPSNKANHCGGSLTSNLNLSACDRCKETTGINQRLVLCWLLVNTNGKRKMNAAPSACEVFNNLTLQVLTSFTKLQTV